VPAALLIVLGLDALPWLARGISPASRARRARVAFVAAVVLLPLLKLRFACFAGLLLGLAWWRSGRRARTLVLAVVSTAALLAAILAFNQARFGAALKTYGLEQLLPESSATVIAARAVGLFFDSAFGLFAVTPLWALLVPGVVELARRQRRLTAELAFLVVPYLVLVSFRREWFGGWSPPFRYGLAVLPLLSLALVPLLAQRHRGGARMLVAALSTATLAFAVLWLAVPGWTYDLADGSTLPLSALDASLRLDVARLLPSAIRLRPAIWWWPLATVAATLLLWRWPRRGGRTVGRNIGRNFATLGVALALAAPGAALVAAARLPTRVVELEDAHVEHAGGGLYPAPWTFDRGRFRGAWRLVAGARASASIVAGGGRLRLRIACQTERPRPAVLVVAAGEREVARVAVGPALRWQQLDVGPLAWPRGAPLVLTVPAGAPPLLVDRVELDWQR
jgi:hypothetical protein